MNYTNKSCFHGSECKFNHKFVGFSNREDALRTAKNLTGRMSGKYLKELSTAIERHKFQR